MMRFLKAFLPNITIALCLAMLVVCYLDMRNPMMGFLIGVPFYTLAALTCVCSITTAVMLYISLRKSRNTSAETKKERNDT